MAPRSRSAPAPAAARGRRRAPPPPPPSAPLLPGPAGRPHPRRRGAAARRRALAERPSGELEEEAAAGAPLAEGGARLKREAEGWQADRLANGAGPSRAAPGFAGPGAPALGPSCSWEWQPHHKSSVDLWAAVQQEARENSEREPVLASYLYSTILAHSSLERALAFILANKLESKTLLGTQLMDLMHDAFTGDCEIATAMRADIMATFDRDPACEQYSTCMLYFKGFQAIQAHRVANCLWRNGRKALALGLQSRVSQVLHVDIHPAATLGQGIMMDHATGVVIGETAEVGDNVSILHHVTLGGSGTEKGTRRHPKIGNGVLLGAGVCVLGPLDVGVASKVGAGSVVLDDVPDHSVAVGVPAKIMAQKLKSDVTPAEDMDQTRSYTGLTFDI